MKLLYVIGVVLFALATSEGKRRVSRLPDSVAKRFPDSPDEHIVGGSDAELGQFPYIISFKRSGSHFCGGSIISKNVILTAGHCVDGQTPSNLEVVAGMLMLDDVESEQLQIRNVQTIVENADYDSSTISNDLALLFLDEDLVLNENVQPIMLPGTSQEEPESEMLVVAGWGTLSSGGSLAEILQFVEVPYVDDTVCRNSYGESEVYDSMICAGDVEEGGIDSCQGDSGGPMLEANNDGAEDDVIVGIVSWGRGCALPGYPGVYTQVSYFLDWISQNS